jgi:hypothetical protein
MSLAPVDLKVIDALAAALKVLTPRCVNTLMALATARPPCHGALVPPRRRLPTSGERRHRTGHC